MKIPNSNNYKQLCVNGEIGEKIHNHVILVKKNRERMYYSLLIGCLFGLFIGLIALWFLNLNVGLFVFAGIILSGIYSNKFHQPLKVDINKIFTLSRQKDKLGERVGEEDTPEKISTD